MSDEFDESVDLVPRYRNAPRPERANVRMPLPAPRLVSRLYAAANLPLRVELLKCLLRPLSPLGLVAVATGAFAGLLQRGSAECAKVAIDDVVNYSNAQILELARFVEQVSPEALQQFASLISDSPMGVAAFSASAVLVLVRALGHSNSTDARTHIRQLESRIADL